MTDEDPKPEKHKVEENEDLPLKENTKKEKKTFRQKLRSIKENVTVEPIFAGLVIASVLSRLAVNNLNLDKACRVKLQFGDGICNSLMNKNGNLTYYEGETQKVIAGIETWKSAIQTGVPTILVIYMGAWSDRTGNRKYCVLLPLLGEFLTCSCNIISTIWFFEIPIEVTMFFEAFFPAMTGGFVMMYLGVFSYISDITNEETRTYRVGMANFCMTAGIPIGTALSGVLLNWLGYYGVFSISGIINLLSFVYGCFYLEKITKPNIDKGVKPQPITIMDSITMVKDTLIVAFKKREGRFRIKIILTLFVVGIIYGPNHGERAVTYMFTRYRLGWDALKYSIYSTFGIIIHSIGALFSISVFSKRLHFHDTVLALISIVSKLAGSIFIAFVQTDFQMFMVPVVEILNATTFTALRSMASKLVPNEEMGKINSLFSLVETLAALMFDPTYSAIYRCTVSNFTGAVFLVSALMTLPPIAILVFLFIQHRRERSRRIDTNEELKIEEVKKNIE